VYEYGYDYGYVMGKDESQGLKEKILRRLPGRGREEVEVKPFNFKENHVEDQPFTMEFEGQVTERGTSLGINLKKEHLRLAQIIRGFRTKITLYRPEGSPFWKAQIVFIPPGEDLNDSRPR